MDSAATSATAAAVDLRREAAARGAALVCVRFWDLVDAFEKAAGPDTAYAAELVQAMQKTGDRYKRAGSRTGLCSVAEGCGRTLLKVGPIPDGNAWFLVNRLLREVNALSIAWRTMTPRTGAEAAGELAEVLRSAVALHQIATTALCDECRTALEHRLVVHV